MKHIVCYSGGHSSALVAIETVRKFGKENVILLNHDISANVEDQDIKRFKNEVAEYLEIEITYANMKGWESLDQFDVALKISAFKAGNGTELCTNRMKTAPFEKYLKENFDDKDCIIYYGFDANETNRIQRRSSILGEKGFKSDYPLALWENRTIQSTQEIGIKKPGTYSLFKHANCVGCLKAGKQHWYAVYCLRPDIWEKAKSTEEKIGYSIIKDVYIEDLEPEFKTMKEIGIEPTEHMQAGSFWKNVRDRLSEKDMVSIFDFMGSKPCECIF